MRVAEWNEVVFTDESHIYLQHHNGRIRVWRHRGERMLNSCVMHRHTGHALGIMWEVFRKRRNQHFYSAKTEEDLSDPPTSTSNGYHHMLTLEIMRLLRDRLAKEGRDNE
ncbi:transposable element Tcb1 transposase [Trichonephila clavipes]|nr:transposable element Tcb1 transposase [Trichonephila clavipes]